MMLHLFAAQAMTPVPPGPAPLWDYALSCTVFAADGAQHRIDGRLDRIGHHDFAATLADRSGKFPFGPAGSRAFLSPPNGIVMNSPPGAEQYVYHFEMPSAMANGAVTVSARQANGEVHYVATGICDVARSKARKS
jgi:hypothetical protein